MGSKSVAVVPQSKAYPKCQRRRALSRWVAAAALAVVVLLVFAAPAQAQDPDTDGLTSVIEQIVLSLDAWKTGLLPFAQRLFILLATLELIWTLYEGLFRRNLGMEDALTLFAKRVFVLLLLYNLLIWAPGVGAASGAGVVIDSFEVIGETASGLDKIRPTSFIIQALKLVIAFAGAVGAYLALPGLNLILGQIIGWMVALVFFSFMVIAISAAIIIIENIFVVAAGFFLLAFSGNRITIGLAQAYPAALLRAGVRLLGLYMMFAIGWNLIDIWFNLVLDPLNWGFTMFSTMTLGVLVYAFMVWRLPRFLADLVPTTDVFNLRLLFQD